MKTNYIPAIFICLTILAFFLMAYAETKNDATNKLDSQTASVREERTPNDEVRMNSVDMARKLSEVFRSHPDPDIPRKFGRLLDQQKIYLMFKDLEYDSAAIVYLPTSAGPKLTLIVSPRVIESLPGSKIYLQLVLYHEWIHVLQQLEKRAPIDLVMANKLLKDEAMAEKLFDSEHEAFLKECRLARKIKASQKTEVCKAFESGGPRAISSWLVREYAKQDRFRSVIGAFERASQKFLL